jgi:hypothetical protein
LQFLATTDDPVFALGRGQGFSTSTSAFYGFVNIIQERLNGADVGDPERRA